MDYEIQQALGRKVDTWEFRVLQQKVESLESDNRQLDKKVNELQNRIQNCSTAITNMFQLLIDSNLMPEKESELRNILMYL